MNHIRRSKSMVLLELCESFDVAVFTALSDSSAPDRATHFCAGK
jgi:hypothetical protein